MRFGRIPGIRTLSQRDRQLAVAFGEGLRALALDAGPGALSEESRQALFESWLGTTIPRRSAEEFLIRSMLWLDVDPTVGGRDSDVAEFYHAVKALSGGVATTVSLATLREWFRSWQHAHGDVPVNAHEFLLDLLRKLHAADPDPAVPGGYAPAGEMPLPDGRTATWYESQRLERSGERRRIVRTDPPPFDADHAERLAVMARREVSLRQLSEGKEPWFPAVVAEFDSVWSKAGAPGADEERVCWCLATWVTPFVLSRGTLFLSTKRLIFIPDVPQTDETLAIPLKEVDLLEIPTHENWWVLEVGLAMVPAIRFTCDIARTPPENLRDFSDAIQSAFFERPARPAL
jgi:hypothetical protein